MSDPNPTGRLVVVSNRLPFEFRRDASGRLEVEQGAGGLVTAFRPILRERGGLWIGWPGIVADEVEEDELRELFAEVNAEGTVGYRGVIYSKEDRDDFYYGFSNEIIWPLFHDLQRQCNFQPRYWDAYERVNQKFAEVVADSARDGDTLCVQDYHLMDLAAQLGEARRRFDTSFFLHIPFPPVDIFAKLPWRRKILEVLLFYDLIGFQTVRDRRNFLQSVRTMMDDVSVEGSRQVVRLAADGRRCKLGVFPISIDFSEFAEVAESRETRARMRELRESHDRQRIILGVDRLDYTKGLVDRLRAYARFLESHPELQGRVKLFQLVVPSRTDIPKYRALKSELDELVGEIASRFSRPDWSPIQFMFGSLDRPELIALYRAADIALVTPLKDGMNLVSKEYCASNVDGSGALVLSEFAGSAAQLEVGALLVNPYDIEETAAAIHRALEMPADERRRRMERMRSAVKGYDIHAWTRSFLKAMAADDLEQFPSLPGTAADQRF